MRIELFRYVYLIVYEETDQSILALARYGSNCNRQEKFALWLMIRFFCATTVKPCRLRSRHICQSDDFEWGLTQGPNRTGSERSSGNDHGLTGCHTEANNGRGTFHVPWAGRRVMPRQAVPADNRIRDVTSWLGKSVGTTSDRADAGNQEECLAQKPEHR